MATGPEDRTVQPSSLCSLGVRPTLMTGLIRTVLQQHFASQDTVENPVLRHKLWANDPITSGISIVDYKVWDPAQTSKRPAIIIKRQAWQFEKMAIGDVSGMTLDGDKTYERKGRGGHVCFCMAAAGDEAELLADEVARFFTEFAPVFRSYWELGTFACLGIDETMRVKEASDRFTVPVPLVYEWTHSWTLRQLVPRIATIQIADLFPPNQ